MNDTSADTALRRNLRTLCWIRMVAFSGQVLAIAYLLAAVPHSSLSREILFGFLALFAGVIALGWFRSGQAQRLSKEEFFAHLGADVALFSGLLFFTGGAANPLVSYYLVPVTIAAITLPGGWTWAVAGLSLVAYSALLRWHLPLPAIAPGHGEGAAQIHTLGMWVNFTVSAGLIGYFVSRMARALNRERERQLEDEQLLALATLAASAAHELGTPLNTIKLLAGEFQQTLTEQSRSDASILSSQVDRCQSILRKLSDTARLYGQQSTDAQPVADYFHRVVDDWRLMRPEVQSQVSIAGSPADAAIQCRPSLAASLHNLLDNAADASPAKVNVDVTWNHRSATVAIRDFGQGGDNTLAEPGRRLGTSEKPGGMGLGLFLARSIVDRHGGDVLVKKPKGDGTVISVLLPLRGRHAEH